MSKTNVDKTDANSIKFLDYIVKDSLQYDIIDNDFITFIQRIILYLLYIQLEIIQLTFSIF